LGCHFTIQPKLYREWLQGKVRHLTGGDNTFADGYIESCGFGRKSIPTESVGLLVIDGELVPNGHNGINETAQFRSMLLMRAPNNRAAT